MNVHKMRRAAQALAEGIPVGLGTDSSCPYVTQYDMWRELAYFFMALPAQPLRAWDKGGVRAPTFSPFRYVFMSGQLRDARHPGAVLG